METEFKTVNELIDGISDGTKVALAPDYSGCAMEVVRGLMRAGRRDLHLVGVPQMGFQGDMLIGAGCVSTVEAAAITLGEFGQAPRFCEAVEQGRLQMLDATCPVIHAGLQAAEKGIPFMPLRGVIGSDLVTHREDWKTIDNPFASGHDPILVFPAIVPDVALFHAPVADRNGNVWIGIRGELKTMAHAAKRTLVTVERIVEDDLLGDDRLAAGTLPSLYVTEIAEAPRGAAPVGLFSEYGQDAALLREYAEMAKTQAGFDSWLQGLEDARDRVG